MSLAADEGTGHFFVYDGNGSDAVYEFSLAGEYLSTIEHNINYVFGAEIAVDNGKNSLNGAENPFGGRYLYVPSHPSGTGHLFAFGPPGPEAPSIESLSFADVTEGEAELRTTVNPHFLETTYTLQYTTKEAFEAEEWSGAQTAGAGTIPAGGSPVKLAASLEGLSPGTTYVFRAIAENEEGSDEAEGEFATYSPPNLSPCPNDPFRNALSKRLPDCRAYELVTPPDTNGRNPLEVGYLGSAYFPTLEASPEGDAASFEIEGGSIPGFEATGSYAGDPYVAHRTEAGWQTEYAGPTGEEAPALLPGSNSPDQGYVFWSTANGEGTAAIGGKVTTYVRYPDGHSELVGRGSLGTDPQAQGNLISKGAGHIIFTSKVQLEEAAPEGTPTIYDRTIDPVTGEEETHVVAAGGNYIGASLDGNAVAFSIGKTLYLRYNDEETYEIGEGLTFAGIAAGGKRIFYLQGGNLFAYEVEGGVNPIAFSAAGDVTPVNVAANGGVAYFISPSVLAGEPNPMGDLPVNGQQNLYRSEEGVVSFVGTVTERDVEGENPGNVKVDGLGLWTDAVGTGRVGKDPSRSTPEGDVLLFSSRADLTGYDSQGHPEIYRYDIAAGELDCISCNPTLAPATGDASLQSISQEQGAPEPGSSFVLMNNLRSDGNRAIFQSTEPLVLADTDGLQDVYEWEAEGVGSCAREGGCVYLISSGQSLRTDYLWAVSDSGNDVFIRTSDRLLGIDSDETPSLYDARVDGGFAEFAEPPGKKPCESEGGCWHASVAPPTLPVPGSRGPGTGTPQSKPCPKGKHKAKRNGKAVCVKNKKHKKHHQKASNKKRGAGK